MAVTPRISLVAWQDRDPAWIFVAVPGERGRYLRTDRSVALTDCPMCSAARGEPCFGNKGTPDGYSATTHAVRRSRAARLGRKPGHVEDVVSVEPAALASHEPLAITVSGVSSTTGDGPS